MSIIQYLLWPALYLLAGTGACAALALTGSPWLAFFAFVTAVLFAPSEFTFEPIKGKSG